LDLVFPTNQSHANAESDITAEPNLVYHILNPTKFSWTADLLPALQKSRLPQFAVVSPENWISKLEESDQDPIKNPSIKLLGYWKGKYDKPPIKDTNGKIIDIRNGSNGEAGVVDEDTKGLLFDLDRTIADCPALGKAPDLIRDGYIDRFVETWMKGWNV
jgi:hypothetical protein